MAAFFVDSIVVHQRAGFLFDPKEGGIGLTRLDVSLVNGFNNNFTAACTDPVTDTLYFVYSPDILASWNTNTAALMQYDYTSKLFVSPYPTNMFYAQVRGLGVQGGVTFHLIADGTDIYSTTRSVQGEFVVPSSTQSAREWNVRLVGTDTVEIVEAADAVEELE